MRLEYSQTQGNFHFNDGEVEPETHGYTTLAEEITHEKAIPFCDAMTKKYAETKKKSASWPDAELMKREFEQYMKQQ